MFLMMVDNLALILVMLVVYQYLHGRIDARFASRQVFSALSGLLFGLAGILSMLDSHALMPGIFFDGRTIVLGIAGTFGGPVVASIAAAMCAGTRLLMGGQGALLGIIAIVEAATLGTIFHELARVKKLSFTAPALLGLALAIHGIQLAINLFLPNRLGYDIIPIIAPTILLLFPLTFLVISWIFLFLQKSQEEHASLNASELRYRTMFENNTAMMLLIDPEDGRIVDANPTAASFYGYSRQTLRQMKITQINTLNQEQAQDVLQRMLAAKHGLLHAAPSGRRRRNARCRNLLREHKIQRSDSAARDHPRCDRP